MKPNSPFLDEAFDPAADERRQAAGEAALRQRFGPASAESPFLQAFETESPGVPGPGRAEPGRFEPEVDFLTESLESGGLAEAAWPATRPLFGGPEGEPLDRLEQEGLVGFGVEEAAGREGWTGELEEAEWETQAGPATEAEALAETGLEAAPGNVIRMEAEDPQAAPDVSPAVAEDLRKQNWLQALVRAIEGGQRDENKLTNLVFFAQHPEAVGRRLDPKNPADKKLVQAWISIHSRLVIPAIQAASERSDLGVSGADATAFRRHFRGTRGQQFKALVEWAAKEVDIDPGLLASTLLAEIGTTSDYLSRGKVSSYRVGADDFYEKRHDLRRRVPAYTKVRWNSQQTPQAHPNDRKGTKRVVNTILFNSGRDALLASAVYLKHGEAVLHQAASEAGKDFDALPVEVRFALVRIAFTGGHGAAKTFLADALAGKDILIRARIPLKPRHTRRNATIRTAQALHLSEWIFGVSARAGGTSTGQPSQEAEAEGFEYYAEGEQVAAELTTKTRRHEGEGNGGQEAGGRRQEAGGWGGEGEAVFEAEPGMDEEFIGGEFEAEPAAGDEALVAEFESELEAQAVDEQEAGSGWQEAGGRRQAEEGWARGGGVMAEASWPMLRSYYEDAPLAGEALEGEADFDREADEGLEVVAMEGETRLADEEPREAQFEQEIIGTDTRFLVSDPLAVPNRWICSLDLYYENPDYGSGRPKWIVAKGTGVLIGARWVLTAAHVMHDEIEGTAGTTKSLPVQKIVVTPARHGPGRPSLGSYQAEIWRHNRHWTPSTHQFDHDFGLIKLKDEIGLQKFAALNDQPLGWWGSNQHGAGTVYRRLDPTLLNNRTVWIAGYPGDKCGKNPTTGSLSEADIRRCKGRTPDEWAAYQWAGSGTLTWVNLKSRLMHHTVDTYKGQSGAPVWYRYQDQRFLVGVHVAPASPHSNFAVRITQELYDEVEHLKTLM